MIFNSIVVYQFDRFIVDFTDCGLGFFNLHRKSASGMHWFAKLVNFGFMPFQTNLSLISLSFGTGTKKLNVLSTELDK